MYIVTFSREIGMFRYIHFYSKVAMIYFFLVKHSLRDSYYLLHLLWL